MLQVRDGGGEEKQAFSFGIKTHAEHPVFYFSDGALSEAPVDYSAPDL